MDGELIGKTVRMIGSCEPWYRVGDIGKITHFDGEHYWVDFARSENEIVEGDGRWFIELHQAEVIGD